MDQFTNDVVYVNLFFDLKVLPAEMLPWAALLSHLLGSLSTEKYPYGELSKALNIHTGGFYTSLRNYLVGFDDNNLSGKFVVTSKAMAGKPGKLFGLAEEILNHTIYDDPSRLKTLLARHHSQVDSQVKGNGYHVASRRLSSYISEQGMFNENTAGLSYYRFISGLLKSFDGNSSELIGNLTRTAAQLFSSSNLEISLTCSGKDLEDCYEGIDLLTGSLPARPTEVHKWNLTPEPLNEGFQTASNVQYVIKGFNYKKLGYGWNGKMRVLNQVLSTDWLQTRIRVIGGAYGGFCNISPGGNFTFSSYRDPNLGATVANFDETSAYLAGFDADIQTMTRYIIGTIAELDSPLTPSQKGDQAVSMYFTKRTREEVQNDRDAILTVSPADIRGFGGMVNDVLRQNVLCVYGSAEKVGSEQHLFKTIVRVP